jgi:alpha-mannosidase
MKRIFTAIVALALLLGSGRALAEASPREKLQAKIAVASYRNYVQRHGYNPSDLCLHVVGQSHLDAAWLWRVAQTREKAYLTFSQAVKHIEEYPGFKFTASSSVYYEWVKEDYPDLFAKIQKYEKEGRWEITGGTWVEPDGNMPEGEAFARQRLLGQRFLLENFGHMVEVEWLLDSFGYSVNYPQILARSGGKYFYTNKPTWNDTTIFPFHFFRWRAPDGSEVTSTITGMHGWMSWFPQPELVKYKHTRYLVKPGTELVADYSWTPERIAAALSHDFVKEFAVVYGRGDGGMGPTHAEVAIEEEMLRQGLAKADGIQGYFNDLAKISDRFPVWNTEIYLEIHRGTLTTHSWIKRANRLGEALMRTAESLRAGLMSFGVEYPYAVVKGLWKLLLLNQFHDILPGSSIPEVYQDARADHDKIQAGLRELMAEGLKELGKLVNSQPARKNLAPVLVYNPLSWTRDGLAEVELGADENLAAADERGTALPSEVIERGGKRYLSFRASAVPGMGYKVFYLQAAGDPGAGPAVAETDKEIALDNGLVRVVIDRRTGLITSLKRAGGAETIAGGGNRLLAFTDLPRNYPAWDIATNYLEHPIALPEQAEVKLTRHGPMFAEVLARRSITVNGQTTVFEQRVRLADNDPLVYLDFDADYRLADSLTKVEFATGIVDDTVAADVAYTTIERPTHPATASEKARWEMYMHKWIDLSGPTGGLAILNNGKYGFSLAQDGKAMRITLVKCAKHPDPWSGATNVYHPKPGEYIQTDLGPQHAELALLAHEGDWKAARLWEDGYEFNTPLIAARVETHEGGLPASGSFVTIESGAGYIASVKKAEDDGDLVVRIVEAGGQSGPATLKLGLGRTLVSASETDLLEFNGKPLTVTGNAVTIDLGPYQIRTIKIKVK